MWKVDLPDVGDIDDQLDAALIHKDGTVAYHLTDAERLAVATLYQGYDSLLGEPDPSLIPVTLDACKDALHTAYNEVQKKGRLSKLRGTLMAAVIECPLCGFEAATTLDHHLPKDDYRALSIYSRNLVPSCQPCNRAKGTLEPVAGKGMIHTYFQDIPDFTFLFAEAGYTAGSLVVTFRIDPTLLPAGLSERLKFQLHRLKLNDRYFDPINIFLFNLKPSLRMFRGKPNEAELIKAFFLASANSYDCDYGFNHWRAALMRCLATSADFLADPWSYLDKPLLSLKAG
ncbi:HNH endonuclease [Mesorhizobium sp. M0757]|uniref:HNH endonuclease n=1 Tax=unclassified Mesorhizobium TaxID=325217 RepID=UPI00333CD2E6